MGDSFRKIIIIYDIQFVCFLACFPVHLRTILVDTSQVESVEEGVPYRCELFALYELETCFCFGTFGNHVSDVLGGGQVLHIRDDSDGVEDEGRKGIIWLFALLSLLPLLVFKYYDFVNESI